MADNLQQRIDQAASGTPLLKPDEQRIYLGTFRERCYVSMTIAQMKKTSNQTALKKALKTVYLGVLNDVLWGGIDWIDTKPILRLGRDEVPERDSVPMLN